MSAVQGASPDPAQLGDVREPVCLRLYHSPPAAFAKTLLPAQAALTQHAREQYRRLAARPALAFTTGDFDPRQTADTLLGRRTPLGRGPCWGWLGP